MAFSLSKLTVATGLATGALLSSIGTSDAHAFGFKFDASYSQDDSPTGDILLESVKIGDEIITEFSYINSAVIVENEVYTGGNTGAASADKGDNATTGVAVEDAQAEDVVTNLANNNLNNIIDTEANGSFIIDLKFGKAIDNLLIWERGGSGNTYGNSDLKIQALDADGNAIGQNRLITRKMWNDAGFQINTTEIGGAQNVGSLGINIFNDLGVESAKVDTIRFISEDSFNGPDWKFVGTDAGRDLESVPEPAFILGLGIFGSVLMLKKRNQIVA